MKVPRPTCFDTRIIASLRQMVGRLLKRTEDEKVISNYNLTLFLKWKVYINEGDHMSRICQDSPEISVAVLIFFF